MGIFEDLNALADSVTSQSTTPGQPVVINSDSQLNPFENASVWDSVVINGTPCPGICKLSGFKRSSGWEIKKGKGVKGSTVTLNEFPPCEGTITFYLWLPEHWDQWVDFRQNFMYDPTKKPVKAVDIYHPSLAAINLTSVVCKDISAEEPESPSYFKIVVSLIEYNPPPKKSAVATPDGSGGSGGGNKSSSSASDAQQQEINRLLDEAKKP